MRLGDFSEWRPCLWYFVSPKGGLPDYRSPQPWWAVSPGRPLPRHRSPTKHRRQNRHPLKSEDMWLISYAISISVKFGGVRG